MNKAQKRLSGWIGAFLFAFALQPALAQIQPANPTPQDEVFAVVNFRCPYPEEGVPPLVVRTGNRFRIDYSMRNNICFDDNKIPIPYAVSLGFLSPGFYEAEVRVVEPVLGPGSGGNVLGTALRQFDVKEGTSQRLTGLWFPPSASGQGFNVVLVDQDTLVVYWLTYDTDGNSLWLFGQGEPGGQFAELDMFRTEGMLFNAPVSEDLGIEPWGQLRLDFGTCGRGNATWEPTSPGFAAGSFPIVQFVQPEGSPLCQPDAIFDP